MSRLAEAGCIPYVRGKMLKHTPQGYVSAVEPLVALCISSVKPMSTPFSVTAHMPGDGRAVNGCPRTETMAGESATSACNLMALRRCVTTGGEHRVPAEGSAQSCESAQHCPLVSCQLMVA